MGVGSKLLVSSRRRSAVSASRETDYGGCLLPAKLTVVVHYLAHQLLNHLLADDAILLACQFSDCLSFSFMICAAMAQCDQ